MSAEEPSRPLPPVDFRADRLDADLALDAIDLAGSVRLRAGRYLLFADHLRLQRLDPEGLGVTGPLRLQLCEGDDPALAFRVDRAWLSPAGDATLRGVRVLGAGRTVAYLPWLLVRPATAGGLLPPRVSYRGSDGLLLGGGVHVPVGSGAALEVEPAAYLKGGSDTLVRLTTERSVARARWEHRGGDLTALDARGVAPGRDGSGALGWEADVIRGDRARRGTIDLDAASRPYDRASVTFLPAAPGSFGLGLRGAWPRGLGAGFFAPRVSWGGGVELGGAGALDLALEGSTLAVGTGDVWHVGRADAGVEATRLEGPVQLDGGARTGALGFLLPSSSQGELFLLGRLAASVPLARRFEGGVVHLFEPGLFVLGGASGRSAGVPAELGRSFATGGGSELLPGLRVGNQLAGPTGQVTVELQAGRATSGTPGAGLSVGRAALRADGSWLRGQLEGLADGGGLAPQRLAVLGSLRAGKAAGLSVFASVSVLRGENPLGARALEAGALTPASGGWLLGEGVSGTTELRLPLGRSVAIGAGATADFTARELMGERGSIQFEDPCGCLSVAGYASRRLGRDGTDVWLSLRLGGAAR